MLKLTIAQRMAILFMLVATLPAIFVLITLFVVGNFTATNYVSTTTVGLFIVGLLVVCIFLPLLIAYISGRRLSSQITALLAKSTPISRPGVQVFSRVELDRSDEVGDIARTLASAHTEVRELMQSVRSDGNKLEVVLNSIDQGIIAVDGQGNIIVVNTAAAVLIDLLPKDIIGQRLQEMFKWTHNKQPFHINFDSHIVNTEVELISPQGKHHFLDLLASKIEDDPNNIRAIITVRNRTEQRELENMKIDFVSMAAHELRTPITSIRGYLSLAVNDETSDLSKEGRHYLERARTSSLHLVGLINNLLNVARIERGAFRMNKTQVNWSDVVRTTLSDQAIAAEEKKINMTLVMPDKDVFVFADIMAVQEVINNIVSNAIHYTLEGGNISVEVRNSDEGTISTHVTDDGIGIPEEARQRLFSKFYRVHEHLDGGNGGSGLGLYISKSIVELHGGKIWVQSDDRDDIGTMFSFTLPVFDGIKHNDERTKRKGLTKRRGWVTKNITG